MERACILLYPRMDGDTHAERRSFRIDFPTPHNYNVHSYYPIGVLRLRSTGWADLVGISSRGMQDLMHYNMRHYDMRPSRVGGARTGRVDQRQTAHGTKENWRPRPDAIASLCCRLPVTPTLSGGSKPLLQPEAWGYQCYVNN